MPRLNAKEHRETRRMECVVQFGRILDNVTAFDTDEKWIEVLVCDKNGKTVVGNGAIQTAKLYIDYDIRDKLTGETLYSVRQ